MMSLSLASGRAWDRMAFTLDFRSPNDRERRRLEDFASCLQTFTGHELPNVLVALQGLARLLLREGDVGPDSRPLLERLAALAQSADTTSRRLAEVGRLLREDPFGPPVDLRDELAEAAAVVNVQRPPSPVALDVAGPLPSVGLARALLHAVLVQILSNAARAGRSGQPVAVRVAFCPEAGGGWLTLQDEGHGMSEAQLNLLCEPFAAGRQPGAAGPGLGFFLVRQAAAHWGGAVRVDSEPGRGTTVSVWLPGAEGGG